jgi:hypothetical protein
MAKQVHLGMKSGLAAAGAATALAPEPAPENPASAPAIVREQIARLAYQYWQERGCPDGSPEEDWLRAERELRTLTAEVAA